MTNCFYMVRYGLESGSSLTPDEHYYLFVTFDEMMMMFASY